MAPHPLLAAALLAACAAPAATAQNRIVVRGGGPALQRAIDAANPGDELDVEAATYDSILVTKGIRILCRSGVRIAQTGSSSPVRIERVPAGQRFELRGGSYGSTTRFLPSLQVSSCAGAVVLGWPFGAQGAAFQPSFHASGCPGPVLFDSAIVGNGGAIVADCAQVSFDSCAFRSAVDLRRSNVALVDCQLDSGLAVDGGAVLIGGGRITGWSSPSGSGDPAIRLQTGELVLAGSLQLIARAWPSIMSIETFGGIIRLGPNVSMTAFNSPPITGPATVLHQHLPSVHASGVASGSDLAIRIEGAGGAIAATFLDLPRAPVSSGLGTLWVSPNSPVLDLRFLPAGGSAGFTVPALVPTGVDLTLQPITLTAAGELGIGTPARVSIR